ncbi:MAG: radical SAM protein [Theionarchaea archaeon]|nr:radical SAM protein [Theionarchaea archaeon]
MRDRGIQKIITPGDTGNKDHEPGNEKIKEYATQKKSDYSSGKRNSGCLAAPNSIIWDVTNRCNLACRHCYVEAREHSTQEPTTEEAMAIMDQLKDAKIFTLSFSGGEPLLRNDIYELLSYATKSFLVDVATNGLLITEDAAQNLKATGIAFLQLSFDGLEEAHDFLRGRKGAFKRLMETIEILKTAKIPFGLTSVIYRKNHSHINAMIALAESLGAFTIRFYRLIHTGRGRALSPLDIEPLEYKSALEHIYAYEGKIRVVADEAFGFLIHGRTNPHQWVGCQAGRTVAGIKANGQVVPCPMFSDPVFYCGKVPEQCFSKIWDSSPVLDRFRTLENIHGKCHSCSFLYSCGGGCRAAIYARTGDLYASDYQCFLEDNP